MVYNILNRMAALSFVLLISVANASHVNSVSNNRTSYVISDAHNFEEDGKLATSQSKILVVYFAAISCPYCKRLEKEIITPLSKSKLYQDNIVLRKINLDDHRLINNFTGQSISTAEFISHYAVTITPTLIFLSPSGVEVANRLIGYQGNEFYWVALEQAIEQANLRLNIKKE